MGGACSSETNVASDAQVRNTEGAQDVEETGGVEEGLEAELALQARLDAQDAKAAAKQKKFDEDKAAAQKAMETTAGSDGQLQLGAREDVSVEEFMAVKPWMGAIVAPSGYTKSAAQDAKPTDTLSIDWVYGFGADTTRENLHFDNNGSLVYHMAALGIVYDTEAHTQRFTAGQMHKDDITCCAVSADGQYAATGVLGKDPAICVWQISNGELVANLTKGHQRSVVTVSFSKDGKFLVSTGLDNDHTMVVWDWQNEKKVASIKTGTDQILSCKYHPDGSIVSAGVKSYKTYTVSGATINIKKGVFGPKGTMQTLTSIAFTKDNKTLTGTFGGDVYVWTGNNVSAVFAKAHKGAVQSIAVDGANVYTGGQDGVVKTWVDGAMKAEVKVSKGAIRALSAQGGKVAVGTSRAEIFILDTASNTAKQVMSGHWTAETWAAATHPTGHVFASAGDEGCVKVWDIAAKKEIASAEFGVGIRSLAYSPDGQSIAIGNAKGEVLILNSNDLSTKSKVAVAKTSVDEIKFSPNGAKIAVGSHDSFVFIIDASTGAKLGTLTGHHEAVWHFDFTADSNYLQTNSRGYELLFWDVNNYKQVTSASAMKDNEWATWTCTLGWPVQGIWPKFADGTDINSVDRTHSGTTIATGDDFAKITLFKYPCLTKGAGNVKAHGHSSHIPTVRFTHDDAFLVSTGGNDRAVIQWVHKA